MVTGSLRASLRPSSRKITPSMISMPQNDMRHIGHVGFDGVVIGAVPFLSSSRSPSIGSGLDLDSRPSTASLPGNGNKGSTLKCPLFGSSVSRYELLLLILVNTPLWLFYSFCENSNKSFSLEIEQCNSEQY